MSALVQDLRYGLRSLQRSRGFTAVVVLTLALGVGLSTTIFTFVNAIMFRPLPYPHPEELISIHEFEARRGYGAGLSLATFADVRAESRALRDAAAYRETGFNVSGECALAACDPERVGGAEITANTWGLLGLRPYVGRTFVARSEVMLGYELWQRRFGGDRALLGATVRVDGVPRTVVGIMPPGVKFPEFAQLWLPLADSTVAPDRSDRTLDVIARRRAGVVLEQVRSELRTIGAQLAEEHPETNRGWTLRAEPERPLRGEAELGQMLITLLGAVGFVLLIACSNAASLMLARGSARRREMAVRAVLGAGRGRLVRQLLTESLILAVAGTLLGVLVSVWGIDLVTGLLPAVPGWFRTEPDWRVLAFAIGLTGLCTLLFGLAPALAVSRPELGESLKEGGARASGGARVGRLRATLVVTEVALSMVLLVGASLMMNGLARLGTVRNGTDPRHVLTLQLSLPAAKYAHDQQVGDFFESVISRTARLPGVEAVAAASGDAQLSGDAGGSFGPVTPDRPSRAAPDESARYASRSSVSTDFFRIMRLPVRAGRAFGDLDRPGAPGVAIVNEAMANALWPGERAVGRQLKLGEPNARGPWLTVVGVVGNHRRVTMSGSGTAASEPPLVYLPAAQRPSRSATLYARTAGDPMRYVAALREAVKATDPDQPVSDVMTLEGARRAGTLPLRFFASLFAAFAGMAMLLAAVGLYGVVAYAVSQRTHEIGIRMALGATAQHVLRLVVRQGLVLALAGVAVGAAGALAVTRLIAVLLFGVTPTDPLTFAGVALVLAGVALLASYVPARRASRVSPMTALRYE